MTRLRSETRPEKPKWLLLPLAPDRDTGTPGKQSFGRIHLTAKVHGINRMNLLLLSAKCCTKFASSLQLQSLVDAQHFKQRKLHFASSLSGSPCCRPQSVHWCSLRPTATHRRPCFLSMCPWLQLVTWPVRGTWNVALAWNSTDLPSWPDWVHGAHCKRQSP